jgi:hypothetical protein
MRILNILTNSLKAMAKLTFPIESFCMVPSRTAVLWFHNYHTKWKLLDDGVSLCSPGWSPTGNSPASVFQALGLQACTLCLETTCT